MKKVFLIILLIAAVAAIALAFGGESQKENVDSPGSYLRVHIRANSNGADDQAVKYEVKEAIVEYLTPIVAFTESKEEAVAALEAALPGIERTANAVLAENGFAYLSRAEIRAEEFPTRVYDGVTLEAGVYDALILELGEGEGANWWCVVYPPLCFSGAAEGENVQFRSRLLDIIRDFFAGE